MTPCGPNPPTLTTASSMPRALTRCAAAAAAEEETSLLDPYCSSDIACTLDKSDLGNGRGGDEAFNKRVGFWLIFDRRCKWSVIKFACCMHKFLFNNRLREPFILAMATPGSRSEVHATLSGIKKHFRVSNNLLSFQHGSDVRRVDAVEVDCAEEAVRVRHPRGRVQRQPREHDLEHALLAHVHGKVALEEVLELTDGRTRTVKGGIINQYVI